MQDYPTRNPRWKERTEENISRNRFMHALGLEVQRIQPGLIEVAFDFQPMHEQQNGLLHGGVSSAVCDIVSGFAAYTLVEAEQKVFTVEGKVSYFNRGHGPRFRAIGRVVKAGARFCFCESELYDVQENKEVLLVKGTATMCVVNE